MATAVRTKALIPLLGGLLGCASSWPSAAELSSDGARLEARARAKAVLQDGDAAVGDREHAANLLGQLGEPCSGCAAVLLSVLAAPGAPDALCAHAAWALGQLDDPAATEALIFALPGLAGEQAVTYVFDALWSQQDRIFADTELQADLAEALNTFEARRSEGMIASARALKRRISTLPVSVRVLDRAIDAWLDRPDPLREAAVVRAIDTVVLRLDEGRGVRERRPDEAWVEVREAIAFLQRAGLVGGPALRRRVWSRLAGRTNESLVARAVAESFFGAEAPVPGRPTHSPRPSERFIGAWLAERVLLARPSVRAALHQDILLWESSPEVFLLLAALAKAREIDLVRELAP